MSITRTARKANYTITNNDLARHPDLSFEARGLMLYLLSHTDNWQVQAEDIEREGKMGREKRQRIFRELESAGYLSASRKRSGSAYTFQISAHDEPLPPEQRTFELGMGARAAAEAQPGQRETRHPGGTTALPVTGPAGNRETRHPILNNKLLNTVELRNTERGGNVSAPPADSFATPFNAAEQLNEPGNIQVELFREVITAHSKSTGAENAMRIDRLITRLLPEGATLADLQAFQRAKPFQALGYYLNDFLDWRAQRLNATVQPLATPAPTAKGCPLCAGSELPGYVVLPNNQVVQCECTRDAASQRSGNGSVGRIFA